jgi:hypothetical protein
MESSGFYVGPKRGIVVYVFHESREFLGMLCNCKLFNVHSVPSTGKSKTKITPVLKLVTSS